MTKLEKIAIDKIKDQRSQASLLRHELANLVEYHSDKPDFQRAYKEKRLRLENIESEISKVITALEEG